MGKKPFSAKAKREQLRQKRQAATRNTHAPSTAPSLSPLTTPSTLPTSSLRRARSQRPSSQAPHRFRLIFAEDTDAARKRHRALAHVPISQLSPTDYAARRMGVAAVRPYPDARYAMPKRPDWTYTDTVNMVDKREQAAFAAWLEKVARPEDPLAAYFERNLETWRQLWRVIERSDVLVLVADIRFPALHFVPELYFYVTEEIGKDMVLALNKCDLVPADVLLSWKQYFETKYPCLAVAMFSSFPDAKLAPGEQNSELLSRREKRMARSKLSAWGADQLLAAIETLPLAERKKQFLGEWRARLDHEREGDDDDNDADVNFLEEAPNSGGINTECAEKQEASEQQTIATENKSRVEREEDIISTKTQKKRRRRVKNESNSSTLSSAPGKGTGGQCVDLALTSCKRGSGLAAENWRTSAEETDTASASGDSRFDPDEEDAVKENIVTIGIVGHPNAGKSSMINGIFRRKVVSTSRTPGHTKHLQTIFLSESVRLCDCPGLVFPGNASRELQILAGMYPISQVREPYAVIKYLAERVPLVDILHLDLEIPRLEEEHEEPGYVSSTGWTAWKICEAWAIKRGFRTAKAARLDVFRAANNILRFALDGRIVLATVPEDYTPDTAKTCELEHRITLDIHDVTNLNVMTASDSAKAVPSGDYYESNKGEEQDCSDDDDDDELENTDAEMSEEEYEVPLMTNAFSLLENDM